MVKTDLLDIPVHLFRTRDIAAHPKTPSHVIAYQHRERLCSPSCAPDGPGIIDLQVLGAIIVLTDPDFRDAFRGRRDHAFRKERHRGPDRVLQDLFPSGLAEPSRNKIIPDLERGLLTGHDGLKFPEPGGNTPVAEERLHPVGKIPGHRYLD